MTSNGCVTKSFELWSAGVSSSVVVGVSKIAEKGGPGLMVWRTKPTICHCMSEFYTVMTVAQRRSCTVTILIVLLILIFISYSVILVVVVGAIILTVFLVVVAALILVVVLLLVLVLAIILILVLSLRKICRSIFSLSWLINDWRNCTISFNSELFVRKLAFNES